MKADARLQSPVKALPVQQALAPPSFWTFTFTEATPLLNGLSFALPAIAAPPALQPAVLYAVEFAGNVIVALGPFTNVKLAVAKVPLLPVVVPSVACAVIAYVEFC